MAEPLSLFVSVQAILKHIDIISFTLLSAFDRLEPSASTSTWPNGSEIRRVNLLLATASQRLRGWQTLWLKPGQDDTAVSFQLWGRSETCHIRWALQKMFNGSLKIDAMVSAAFEQHRVARKEVSLVSRLSSWLPKRAPTDRLSRPLPRLASASEIPSMVETLLSDADYLEGLSEMAFHRQSGCLFESSNLQIDLDYGIPALFAPRRYVHRLIQLCVSNDTAIDVNLSTNLDVNCHIVQKATSSKVLLRFRCPSSGPNLTPVDYRVIALQAKDACEVLGRPRSAGPSAFGLLTEEGALFSGMSFLLPPADQSERTDSIVLVEEFPKGQEQRSSCKGYAAVQTKVPLVEGIIIAPVGEKVRLAYNIACHALLFLGSAWGNCFAAMNIRRQLDPRSGYCWVLHVHDPNAGLLSMPKSMDALFRSQALDIGLLLVGFALNRQVVVEGEDVLSFASRTMPLVEKLMGSRYKWACMFCLTVQRMDLQCFPSDRGTDPRVVTHKGHDLLRLLYLHVCVP